MTVRLGFSLRPSAKLRRIDLSGNLVSAIDEDALRLLPALRDLLLPGNRLVALPRLPPGVEVLDVRRNRLRSAGIPPGAFGVSPEWGQPCSGVALGSENQTHVSPGPTCFIEGSFCGKNLI